MLNRICEQINCNWIFFQLDFLNIFYKFVIHSNNKNDIKLKKLY